MKQEIELKDIKEGDFVWHGGDSSFCHPSIREVVKVVKQVDQNTKDAYNEIYLEIDESYDSRDGGPIEGPLAYYILPADQEPEIAIRQAKEKKRQLFIDDILRMECTLEKDCNKHCALQTPKYGCIGCIHFMTP